MWRMLAEALAERASTPTTMLSARTTSLMCVGVDAAWRLGCDCAGLAGCKRADKLSGPGAVSRNLSPAGGQGPLPAPRAAGRRRVKECGRKEVSLAYHGACSDLRCGWHTDEAHPVRGGGGQEAHE